MAWTLEIHHIDVKQGDATLIVAREVAPLVGGMPIVRSVLIDGGRANQAATIHNYITGTANVALVNVIVVTHYDGDHLGGITELLANYNNTYNGTYIFDQGWPGDGGTDNSYTNYVRAINGRGPGGNALNNVFGGNDPGRVRMTKRVLSYGALGNILFGGAIPAAGTAAVPAGAPGTINLPARQMVGVEIMWTNNVGVPSPVLYGGGALPGAAGGPPSLTCIAANEYVLQAGGNRVRIPSGLNDNSAEGRNARSLVFVLQFDGFRYYIGGDIQSVQEDDPNAVAAGIGAYLNTLGQIHGMKASHHGSGESSSAAFIAQLDPVAAFISCGIDNNFGQNPAIVAGNGPWPNGHPQQRVLVDLEASANLQNYYLTEDRSTADCCRRLNQGVGIFPLAYTASAKVSGSWGSPQANWGVAPGALSPCGGQWPNDTGNAMAEGHIVVRVNNAAHPAFAAPLFSVTRTRPTITVPVLSGPLTLPANVNWPNGQALPAGTLLPAATVWPNAAVLALTGMSLSAAYTLIATLPWVNGTPLPLGAVLPAGFVWPVNAATDLNGFSLINNYTLAAPLPWPNGIAVPVNTILPAGIVVNANLPLNGWSLTANFVLIVQLPWVDGMQLPVNTILPNGFVWPGHAVLPLNGASLINNTVLPAGVLWANGQFLPAGTTLPANAIMPDGTVLNNNIVLGANVLWADNQPLPVNSILPLGTVFPNGATWPANAALPALRFAGGIVPPNNFILPVGTTLPATTVFQNGVIWPANTAWPQLRLPAGMIFPNGAQLPVGTIIPANTAFPNGVTWPANTALPSVRLPAGQTFPNGTQLPIGMTLPANTVFVAGTAWPANTALPALTMPAGINWPNGNALPANTILPVASQLPPGIGWPATPIPNGGNGLFITNH